MIFLTMYLYLFLALCVIAAFGWPTILAVVVNTYFHSVYIILGGILLNILWLYVWVNSKMKP